MIYFLCLVSSMLLIFVTDANFVTGFDKRFSTPSKINERRCIEIQSLLRQAFPLPLEINYTASSPHRFTFGVKTKT